MLLAESASENYTSMGAEFPKQVEADAGADRRRAGIAPDAGRRGGADARRDVAAARRSGCCWRRSAARSRPTSGTWSRCSTPSSATTASAPNSVRWRRTAADPRRAARCSASTTPSDCSALCQEQIAAYADPEAPVVNEELELLAESLSGLGFYIEAVEQQRPDRDRLIAPLLAQAPGRGAGAGRRRPRRVGRGGGRRAARDAAARWSRKCTALLPTRRRARR